MGLQAVLLLLAPMSLAQDETPLGPGELIDGVVHRVNGEVITRSDLEKGPGAALASAGRPEDIELTIRRVVRQKLQAQAASDLDISISKEELDRQIEWIVRREHGGDFGQLLQVLSANGWSLNDFRDRREEELKVREFYRRKGFRLQPDTGPTRSRSRFDLDVTVTEIRRYYQENPEAAEVRPRVRLIRVRVPEEESATVEETRRAVEALRTRLVEQGLAALRDELVARYGEEAVVDLGLLELSDELKKDDPALYSLATHLSLGSWSDPLSGELAFELFFLAERQPARHLSFAEAQSVIRGTLLSQKIEAAENRVLQQLILESDPQTQELLLGPMVPRRR